jgi:hypothetical protein
VQELGYQFLFTPSFARTWTDVTSPTRLSASLTALVDARRLGIPPIQMVFFVRVRSVSKPTIRRPLLAAARASFEGGDAPA